MHKGKPWCIKENLKRLEHFVGCGGLSEVFNQAGIINCRWAVESDEFAVEAFKLNNPDCTVFNEDCILILHHAI